MAQRERSVHIETLVFELRRIRMEKHLTQKQLARKAGRGMTQAFISKIEARRHKEPNFSTLVRMAEALDCNLEITVKPK